MYNKYIDYININFIISMIEKKIEYNNILSDFGFNDYIIGVPYNEFEKYYKDIITYNLKCKCCVEISNEDINCINKLVRKYNNTISYISLKSNDENIIRKSLDINKIRFLIPSIDYNVANCNQTIAKIASKKEIIFLFETYPLLKYNGYKRVKYLSGIMNIIPILRKYNVKFILVSNATSIY